MCVCVCVYVGGRSIVSEGLRGEGSAGVCCREERDSTEDRVARAVVLNSFQVTDHQPNKRHVVDHDFSLKYISSKQFQEII